MSQPQHYRKQRKPNPQSNPIAQDSSEIFDTYKQGVLKITEEYLNSNHNMHNQFQTTTRILTTDKRIR